jgi:hypothetical protein
MSPTLDERATTSDPRITTHITRSAFLLALHRAIELDGLPAPRNIRFEDDGIRLVMDEDAVADVEDWAHYLGVTVERQPLAEMISTWQRCVAGTAPDRPWHGFPLRVSCAAKPPRAGA